MRDPRFRANRRRLPPAEGLYWADSRAGPINIVSRRAGSRRRRIQTVTLLGFDASDSAALHAAIERGRTIGESANFTRDLINEPPNRLTPKILAQRAEAMANEVGLGNEVLDERKIAELKMGALIGVAQGSHEPPRVIVLRYKPDNPKPNAPTLGLVGKAVTFDSGGLSLKPAGSMEKMKYDMGGGALPVALALMRALAFLKPSIPVICVIPATENMPGGRAQRPGDVVTAMSGKTIEVLNTDAEGRLILADAMYYARKLGSTHLVDAATLTGAVEVALGNVHVGAFRHSARMSRSVPGERQGGRRKNVAAAHRRRLPAVHQKRDRGYSQYRLRKRWRCHHRCLVHQGVRRRYAVGPSRYRRNHLD